MVRKAFSENGQLKRLDSVDCLRGVVMILMALDHVREYFGHSEINPTDLSTTTVALFVTRWVTHFCAPVFFLLAGTGAALAARSRSIADLSRFLVVRGLWLIVLELVLVRWIMQFNTDYRVTIVTVFWAVGWSMVVLALLMHLPGRWVATIGIVLIVARNLVEGVRPSTFGSLAPLWTTFHSPGILVSDPRHLIFVAYPVMPWAGVVAAGYGLGRLYTQSAERRRALLWRVGVGLTLMFLIIRGINLFGDPARWTVQRSIAYTAISFLNTNKYPPSLLFVLMTIGPALCALAWLDRGVPDMLRAAVEFGRVPFFYFLIHLFAIHVLAVAVCYARYRDAHWMFESPTLDRYPFTQPPGWGFDLPIVYAIWVLVVVALYPLCRWYASIKQRRNDWWLRFV